MRRGNKQQVFFYAINGKPIKYILIIDLVIGTGIYYIVKIIAASVTIATVGSVIGSEGIKRIEKRNAVVPVKRTKALAGARAFGRVEKMLKRLRL
ncbi:hypothetical protein ACF3MZ_08440 [Paenibacillaceae bacterium WGS1546]|uniref:hypothetical protein n=1 Tax=Cohnella sp. WGS1546 TaxID=3366810 RepID=UPI00372D7935